MNLLLDTHILLWHLADDPKLSLEASALIENETHNKFLSIVSLWEIKLKRILVSFHSLNRLIPCYRRKL